MDEPGFGADIFPHVRQERDDVMFHFALDLIDARHVELRALPDPRDSVAGNDAQLGLRLAGQDLDFEPDGKPVLVVPDAPHRGARISLDHVVRRLSVRGMVRVSPPRSTLSWIVSPVWASYTIPYNDASS